MGESPNSVDTKRNQPLYTRDATNLPPGENTILRPPTEGMSPYDGADLNSPNWLIQKAKDMYQASSDYLDANITTQWEKNLNHFNNQHASSSKLSAAALKRSKIFRPKTRSMVKGQEAALAVAAFGSENMLIVKPVDSDNEKQRISASITKSLLDYRLKKTIKWFLTSLGSWQDTKNYGICISHQYWAYEEDSDIQPALDEAGNHIRDDDGTPMGRKHTIIRKDEPCVDVIAPENFRFDPMCDWRDPANTSPYLVYMMPIYVGKALEMMENVHPVTGQPVWMKHDRARLLSTIREDYTRTRQAREGDRRIDPSTMRAGSDFTTVWAHLNICTINGEDYGWWTMGTELLLTKAVPLKKMYPHLKDGQRPFVVGFASLEAHKNYPAGDVELASGIQEEINVIANQRIDNVKLVLNKRYYVKRGSQVDLQALARNVPGGGVMMNDPEHDVKTVDTNDVTASSYQEQDRLAVEMDEMVGSFSQSSVQNNRQLGETVGGMSMVQQSSGSVQDYSIRVFMVTWMEPVLRQLAQLEHMYETDTVLLAIAAKQSELWEKYGVDQVTDDYLKQELTIDVDVGIGNTDPVRRVERLTFGVEKVAGLPGMPDRIKSSEIANEIFGSLGYKTADRFFMSDEEYEQKVKKNPPQPPLEIQLEKMRNDSKKYDVDKRFEKDMKTLEQTYRTEEMKTKATGNVALDKLDAQTEIATQTNASREKVAVLSQTTKTRELNMKTAQGSGI